MNEWLAAHDLSEGKQMKVSVTAKDPMDRPEQAGEFGGRCPDCKLRGTDVPTIARRSRVTHELYFGCPNFGPPHYCRFNGCRSH